MWELSITGPMNKMKRIVLLLLYIILIACSCANTETSNNSTNTTWDFNSAPPHFTVNGITYWDNGFGSIKSMSGSYKQVGTIKEIINDPNTSDWQGYLVQKGSKIYLDPQDPYTAYLDGYCYVAQDINYRLIIHNSETFVYLGDMVSDDSAYYKQYRDKWNYTVDLEQIKSNSEFLGVSTFDGYNKLPTTELGNNYEQVNKINVYQNTEDTNVIFCVTNDIASVFVKKA